MLMKTANPALNAQIFNNVKNLDTTTGMTIQGTVNKTFIALMILMVSATFTWVNPNGGLMMMGAIGGFITAIITAFKKEWAPTATPFMPHKGLFLGGISVIFNQQYPGIVIQAVYLTFEPYLPYSWPMHPAKSKSLKTLNLAWWQPLAGFSFMIINMILGFFGMGITSIYGNGMIGIGFSLIVVGIAALNLVLDFDFIEQGAQQGAPKYMEWYGALG